MNILCNHWVSWRGRVDRVVQHLHTMVTAAVREPPRSKSNSVLGQAGAAAKVSARSQHGQTDG